MYNKKNKINMNSRRANKFENMKIILSNIDEKPWYKFAELRLEPALSNDTTDPYAIAEFEIHSCNNIDSYLKFIFRIEYTIDNKLKLYINESKKILMKSATDVQEVITTSPFDKNDLKIRYDDNKFELYFRIKSPNEDFSYRLNNALSNKISVSTANSPYLINEEDLNNLVKLIS